jgi:hypothetical protein
MIFTRRRTLLALLAALAASLPALAAQAALADHPPLARDDFTSFDTGRWAVEAEGNPLNPVHADGRRLILESDKGLTLWLRQPLSGHYEIAFTRRITDTGAPFERLSDMNFFWAAQLDTATPFSRSGRLADYDTLPLYYAGIGGNGNTTTRFRRYDAAGTRPLLAEFTDPSHLLRANHDYRIRIAVDGQGTRLYVDDALYFADPGPLPASGYFAFRSTKSRQEIADFSARRLP